MRFALVVSVGVVSLWARAAHADGDEMVVSCGSAQYDDTDGFNTGRELAVKVEASEIPSDEKQALASTWSALVDRNDQARTDKADLIRRCNEAKDRADATRARIDQFNSTCTGQDAPESCGAQEQALRAEVDERHAEMIAIQQDIDAYGERLVALEADVESFVSEGQRTLAKYFTGKRVFHVTAKSWIDGSSISEFSFRAMKLLLEQDDEPTGPEPRGDYRLYQTFVVEVNFKQGRIVKAKFLPDSLQKDAGKTKVPVPVEEGGPKILFLRFKGSIYVTNQKVSISADRESVVFTRTVEGHPSLVILSLDKLVPFGQMGALPTIWNSLRLEVTADAVTCTGDGSSFPSHRFWIGDGPCDPGSKGQVQPSEYFGVGE